MQIMRFDVVPMPVDVKPRPFTVDDQCALNNAMRAHWEMTAKPLGNGPFPIRRVSFDRHFASFYLHSGLACKNNWLELSTESAAVSMAGGLHT